MHVQADPVAGLVQVEALVAAVRDVLFELALEQAEPEQALGQGLDHGLVTGLVASARPRLRPRGGLRGPDQVVQRALPPATAAVDRDGDIGRRAVWITRGSCG